MTNLLINKENINPNNLVNLLLFYKNNDDKSTNKT
jgi:hypothetical protein